jgi:ethanolamine ammonia-lyase small subunit
VRSRARDRAPVVVLIGERPGLSVADSLGIYLTHLPRPGRADADRNCISNIHPPAGLGYAQAAKALAGLVSGAWALGRSGVDLKDTSRTDAMSAGETISIRAGATDLAGRPLTVAGGSASWP